MKGKFPLRSYIASTVTVVCLLLTNFVGAEVNETPDNDRAVLFEPCAGIDVASVAGPLERTATLQNYKYVRITGADATMANFLAKVVGAGVAQIATHAGPSGIMVVCRKLERLPGELPGKDGDKKAFDRILGTTFKELLDQGFTKQQIVPFTGGGGTSIGIALTPTGIKDVYTNPKTGKSKAEKNIVLATSCETIPEKPKHLFEKDMSHALSSAFRAKEYFGYSFCVAPVTIVLDTLKLLAHMDGTNSVSSPSRPGRLRPAGKAFSAATSGIQGQHSILLKHEARPGDPSLPKVKGNTTLAPIVKWNQAETDQEVSPKDKIITVPKRFPGHVIFDTKINTKKVPAANLLRVNGCNAVLQNVRYNGDNEIDFDLVLQAEGKLELTVVAANAISANNDVQLDGNTGGKVLTGVQYQIAKDRINLILTSKPSTINGVGQNQDDYVFTNKCVAAPKDPPFFDTVFFLTRPIPNQTIAVGEALEFSVAEPGRGNSITVTSSALPRNATFEDTSGGEGNFRFRPDASQTGASFTVTFSSSDVAGLIHQQTASIIVEARNEVLDIVEEGVTAIGVPGTKAIGTFTVNNAGNTKIANITISRSDLIFNGKIISAGNVSFDPDTIRLLSPGASEGVTVTVDIPPGQASGDYLGTFGVAANGSVTDTAGLTLTVDDPPVLTVPGPQTVSLGQTITFTVGATDADFDPIILFTDLMPIGASFVDNGDGTGIFTFTSDNDLINHRIDFVASDGKLQTAKTVLLVTSPFNSAPVADAGFDQTLAVGDSTTLNGLESFDPEVDPLTFFWSEDSRNPQIGILSDPTSASPTITPSIPGTFVFNLMVSDDLGASATDSVVVNVLQRMTVNNLVTFTPLSNTTSTSYSIGCPPEFVGTFSFDARLTNASASSLSSLIGRVVILSNGNLLQNADGGPGGVGPTLRVPTNGSFSDGVLSPGEFVDVPFNICLKDRNRFSFFLDVSGAVQ
jgi:hypothetical protein